METGYKGYSKVSTEIGAELSKREQQTRSMQELMGAWMRLSKAEERRLLGWR